LVGKVSFTDSPGTGSVVLRTAAANLTPTLMELGGKNPLLVFDDADIHQALLAATDGGFFNQGEACTASSRILFQDNIFAEFAAKLAAAVSRLRVGDGADPATEVGPLVTAAQQKRVLDYLDIGVAEGARIAAQAPLPTDPRLANGFYVPPTVLTDVTPDMRVATEEIFGPVVTLTPFADEDEAVRTANGTPFGLVAGVFSQDSDRVLREPTDPGRSRLRQQLLPGRRRYRIRRCRPQRIRTRARPGDPGRIRVQQDHPAGRQARRAAALDRSHQSAGGLTTCGPSRSKSITRQQNS
jgi:acyl-CoA reductase-like NAD-dependent aldehyde dehydrogenase